VRAAGVCSDRGAHEGQHGGEDDLSGSDPGEGGGAGGEAADGHLWFHAPRDERRIFIDHPSEYRVCSSQMGKRGLKGLMRHEPKLNVPASIASWALASG
jgi:hypothetical protein